MDLKNFYKNINGIQNFRNSLLDMEIKPCDL